MRLWLGAIILLTNSFGATAVAGQYNFTRIVDPFAALDATTVSGVNNAGDVVGTYSNSNGYYGFVDVGGKFTTISDPLALYGTYATAINDAGTVTGDFINNSGTHGFIYTNGNFTTIDDPASKPPNYNFFDEFLLGINNAGSVVGWFASGSHGFIDTNGSFTTFDAPFPEAGATYLTAINNKGTIAGYYGSATPSSPYISSFIDADGIFTILNAPSASFTEVSGINDGGAAVGNYFVDGSGPNSGWTNFLYENETFTSFTNPLFPDNEIDFSGINDSGEIVGDARVGIFGVDGFVAIPEQPIETPEPGSACLFAAGLLGLTISRWRRLPNRSISISRDVAPSWRPLA